MNKTFRKIFLALVGAAVLFVTASAIEIGGKTYTGVGPIAPESINLKSGDQGDGSITLNNDEGIVNSTDGQTDFTFDESGATLSILGILTVSLTPADGDAFYLRFKGEDDYGRTVTYAQETVTTDDVSSNTLDSTIKWAVITAGSGTTPTNELELNGARLFPTANAGLDLGSGSYRFGTAYTSGLDVSGDVAVTGAVTRTAQVLTFTDMKVMGASGTDWVITDTAQTATLVASQTSETLMVKITGLHTGDIITKLNLVGQVESAGGAVVLDADLRKVTAVAADLTDASVATIVRPTVAADTVLSSAATKGVSATFSETVEDGETFYVKVTGTTAASTDIALQGIQLTVTQK